MIVVADTTPIITLMKLQRLDLLEKLFGTVIVPNAVYEELISNTNYLNEKQMIIDCPFLKRLEISDRQSIKILREVVGLDAGESEAIALTEEKHADLLIIDERKGRRVAKQMELKITGTIGILLQAFDCKILSQEEILSYSERLRDSRIRISDSLFALILDHVKKMN
ncbi:MAG: hypothetical protein IJQ82_11165 [Selenomonadaceae bacterium]|nr:hypothetical protein [Selenomonadaceae bacterium]